MACSKTTSISLLVFTTLLLALVHTTSAQTYHFSNGWNPGKKRSSDASSIRSVSSGSSSSLRAFDESCNMRPETILLINKILQEEAARIQKTCTPDAPMGLRELLENAAGKMGPENKW